MAKAYNHNGYFSKPYLKHWGEFSHPILNRFPLIIAREFVSIFYEAFILLYFLEAVARRVNFVFCQVYIL